MLNDKLQVRTGGVFSRNGVPNFWVKKGGTFQLAFPSTVVTFSLNAWGTNANGRTGLTFETGVTTSPTQVGSFTDWTFVDFASESHGLAIRDGKLYAWGNNANARTGLGTTTGATNVPTQVGTDTGWTFASAGVGHSLGIRNGVLFAWGSDGNGRTGLGFAATSNTTTPTQVGSFTDWTWVSAGNTHSLGIRDGKLYAWGNNANGITGLGSTSGSTNSPTQVGSFTDWTLCDAGRSTHSLAIRDGKLYSFGANAFGATGLNTTTGTTTTPTQVGSASDWDFAACDGDVSAGIRSGQLFTWGNNAGSVTGLGTTSGSTTTPTLVGSFTDWDYVSVSFTHAFGIRNGSLYAWGSNTNNALAGVATTATPTQVGTATDWVIARAGREASFAGRAA